MSDISPARIGFLVDTARNPEQPYAPDMLPIFEMVAEEYTAQGLLDRPVEFVVRAVEGLPRGTFRAVRDAFYELVEEDCLVIFGPYVSENTVPLREHVERTAQVPILSMAGTETMLGEWVFALNNGSMPEEPRIMAAVATYDGCKSVGIAYEASLIGEEYLRSTRVACKEYGLRVTAEVAIPQVEHEKQAAMAELAGERPDAIMHVGFGLGLFGMNEALQELEWMPRRYTTTAFEFAAGSPEQCRRLAGWVGLDSYDERNQVGQDFLDRYHARTGRRPAYFMPVYLYDMARVIVTAIADARPLTGLGVKEALERIKMMPAASGAPGTRLRFGRYIRQAWVGSEYLVARRVLDDGSGTVIYGTIEGLVTGTAVAAPADDS
jgi:ABC-type branched-subunit amino acid transport system substrate-binding protein